MESIGDKMHQGTSDRRRNTIVIDDDSDFIKGLQTTSRTPYPTARQPIAVPRAPPDTGSQAQHISDRSTAKQEPEMRSFSETRNGTIVQAGRVGSPSGTALSISADAYEQAQQQLPINRRNQPSRLQGVRQIDARALKSIKRHLPTFNNFVDETPFPKDNIRNSPNKPDTSHSASPYLISYKGTKGTIVIDLDKEDELEKKVAETDLMQDEDYEDLFLPSTDIKLGDHLPGMKGVSPAACRRNGTPETSFDILERFSSDNRTLKAGKTVEMTDGDFLRIRSVLRDRTSTEVILRGHRLRRVKHLNGVLELKMNELAMVLEVEDSDPRDAIVQGVEQVPLSQIGRARELIITNRPYPDLSFRVLEQTYLSQEYIFDNCRLVCRWKYILSFRTARERVLNKNCEKSLVRFHTSELGKESSVSEDVLRRNWRGDTIKGGSCLKTSPEEEEFDAQERQMSRGSDLLSFNQRIQTVGSATRSLKSPSKKRSNSSGSSTNWPEMIPTSSINGSSTSPVVLDEDKSIVFTSPTIQIRRSSPKTYDRNQKMKHQIMIDITGDECPRISLKNLSISERQSGPASHDQTQSKGLHGPPSRRASRSLQGSDAIMSPKHTLPLDVVEISAQITTKSKRGIFRAEYAGVLPCLDHCSTPAKRLKKSNTTVVDAAFTDAYCYPSTQADMLWSSPPVPISPPQLGAPASSITSESTMSPETMLRDADRTRILPTRKLLTNSSSESSTRHTSTRKTSKPTLSQQKQRYTFGDAFCGAGGTSRGAKSAGFHVDWGFDFDPAAITSYQLNFYEAKCLAAWAHDFVQISEGDESKVDVLHLSPPCQVFSFAHTVDGKDDEMNTATFFAVVELVKRARPRVVTLENTSGLAVLYPLWLNTAINFFTSLGFSIRWKILNFAEYGLAQARKRLIIIASCPGEALPPFPKPTHGKVSASSTSSGLAPLVTVRDVISSIPSGFPNHDVEGARPRNEPPYLANQPLRSCITTSGGGNIHPSGKRDLTHREFACLQGFPLEHKFGPVRIKRQIGNAVPPLIAKVLLEEIKKALLKADGY